MNFAEGTAHSLGQLRCSRLKLLLKNDTGSFKFGNLPQCGVILRLKILFRRTAFEPEADYEKGALVMVAHSLGQLRCKRLKLLLELGTLGLNLCSFFQRGAVLRLVA